MTALQDSLKPQVTMKQSVHDSSGVSVSVVANFCQVLSCKNYYYIGFLLQIINHNLCSSQVITIHVDFLEYMEQHLMKCDTTHLPHPFSRWHKLGLKVPDWPVLNSKRGETWGHHCFTWLLSLWPFPRSTAKQFATDKLHSNGTLNSTQSKWIGLLQETSVGACQSVWTLRGKRSQLGMLSTSHRYAHFSCNMETNCWCRLMKHWSHMASDSSMCQETTLKAVPQADR